MKSPTHEGERQRDAALDERQCELFDDRRGASSLSADEAFQRDYLALVRANFSAPVFRWRWTLRTVWGPLHRWIAGEQG